MGKPYNPETRPPGMFGESYFGITLKLGRANVQSTGWVQIGDNWRKPANQSGMIDSRAVHFVPDSHHWSCCPLATFTRPSTFHTRDKFLLPEVEGLVA